MRKWQRTDSQASAGTATVRRMADKGWTARIATAAGAAAGTGAAQLGLGYGLGVVVWPVTPTSDDSAWLGSLGWATWITASATVFGAVLGSRFRDGPGPRTNGSWRFALAACAAVGSLVTVALIALPARSAVWVEAFAPQVIAGGYAVVGLLLGLIVAFWAVSSRPVAANLMATGVWLWALAVAGIVVELTVHRDSATYLTSWQFTEVANSGRYGAIYWPSALLTLGAAFLVGVLAATPAARRGDLGAGAATSGVAGPLLVAFAFLALAPRLTGALGPIESAYLIAPYAVLAGLAGSALAVTTGRFRADRRASRTPAASRPGSAGRALPGPARSAPDTAATSPNAAVAPTSPDAAVAPPSPDAAVAAPRTRAPSAGLSEVPATGVATPDDRAKRSRSGGTSRTKLFGRSKVPAQPAGSAEAPAAESARPARPATDPEIAAAVRPSRPRPKKAAPAPEAPKNPRSTVTPPPATPAIAQINPAPPAKS